MLLNFGYTFESHAMHRISVHRSFPRPAELESLEEQAPCIGGVIKAPQGILRLTQVGKSLATVEPLYLNFTEDVRIKITFV